MSRTTLTLRRPPPLRLDLRGLTPARLDALGVDEIERLPLGMGRDTLALAECFSVQREDADGAVLHLVGDLARCDRVGWQMDGGRLVAEGTVGDHAGAGMRGGELTVLGSAGTLAACEMAGGRLTVQGDVGDFAAGALPGSMDGMRGGHVTVHGRAGERLGDRMRRGTVVVFGDVGDFCASRMVAGTLAVGGRCGAHPAFGMRRGSLVLAGPAPEPPPGFVPANAEAEVFWQLLARELQTHGGPFAALAERRVERHLGDLAVEGKGELIVPVPST
jgi:formylmethanofuran dehydrogenase subunit C